jgi:hypothetical protein
VEEVGDVSDDFKRDESDSTFEPLNDVTDHYQKHMGLPNKKADLNVMPKPVRYFYYFVVGFVSIAFILFLYTAIFM